MYLFLYFLVVFALFSLMKADTSNQGVYYVYIYLNLFTFV